jgi:hypothetical protein
MLDKNRKRFYSRSTLAGYSEKGTKCQPNFIDDKTALLKINARISVENIDFAALIIYVLADIDNV